MTAEAICSAIDDCCGRSRVRSHGTAIAVDQGGYLGTFGAIFAYLIVGAVLLVRRRRIEPVADRR